MISSHLSTPSFAGAIFDQDGLLFDTEVIFARSWRQAGKEIGVEIPDALTHACCGCGERELPAIIARFLPQINHAAYLERVFQLSASAQMAQVPSLKLGVREMLNACRERGIRLAVASSSIKPLIERNLLVTGLREYFSVIVAGRDVSHGKPAPDIFLKAAAELNLPPNQCLVFEDSPSGIRAAYTAGCSPIMIPDRVPPTEDVRSLCRIYSNLLVAAHDLF